VGPLIKERRRLLKSSGGYGGERQDYICSAVEQCHKKLGAFNKVSSKKLLIIYTHKMKN
jgi:hypothetical protein